MSEKKSKKELLEHYAEGDIHRFLQLDGWTNVGDGDYVMRPDEDGDVFMCGGTDELRHSDEDLAVRVLIHENTEHGVALRILKKILVFYADGGIPHHIIGATNGRMSVRHIPEEVE